MISPHILPSFFFKIFKIWNVLKQKVGMKKKQLVELIRFLNEVSDTVQVPRSLRVRAYGLSIRINSEHTGEDTDEIETDWIKKQGEF